MEEVEAQALRPTSQEIDLPAELGSLLLEAADVRQLRLGALGEVLLVSEALDEALEPCDVRRYAWTRISEITDVGCE